MSATESDQCGGHKADSQLVKGSLKQTSCPQPFPANIQTKSEPFVERLSSTLVINAYLLKVKEPEIYEKMMPLVQVQYLIS